MNNEKHHSYTPGHANPSVNRRVSKTYSLRVEVAEGVINEAKKMDISASAWADKILAKELNL